MTTDNPTAPVQGLTDAARRALEDLEAATSFTSRKSRDRHAKTVADLRAALAAAPHTATPVVQPVVPPGWLPIETAPRDGTPIIGWCVHDADPYYEEDGRKLTIYGAHTEGLGHVPDGAHVIVWGGAFDDSTWEEPGAFLPDWWFRDGSDFEQTANPTHWMPLPAAPASDADSMPAQPTKEPT